MKNILFLRFHFMTDLWPLLLVCTTQSLTDCSEANTWSLKRKGYILIFFQLVDLSLCAEHKQLNASFENKWQLAEKKGFVEWDSKG